MSGVKLGGRESADLTIPECGLGFGHYVYDSTPLSTRLSCVLCLVSLFYFVRCNTAHRKRYDYEVIVR